VKLSVVSAGFGEFVSASVISAPGSTNRSHEVLLAKTGMLWVKRAGDRRSCSFLARNFLGKTWNGHQKQKTH
jgi:hypothetical protein